MKLLWQVMLWYVGGCALVVLIAAMRAWVLRKAATFWGWIEARRQRDG